jgi:hypothetical protein
MTHPDHIAEDLRASEALFEAQDIQPGFYDYQARMAFRDLVQLHGFDAARRLMFQIINTENERKHHG